MEQKTALICTTLNCKDELEGALRTFTTEENLSLLDELVVVDGGSNDGTWELLEDVSTRIPKIKAYRVPGANISTGRNEAIRRTDADIIVTFDSGTHYCDGWLRMMLEPFKTRNAEVTGGQTIYAGETLFESCMGSFKDRAREAIQPSHRGCAFKRNVWERIGGYPEHVEAGEDTWFNSQWRALGCVYVHVPDAEQYWRVRSNWKAVFKMARRNTRGHVALGEKSGTLTVTLISILHILLGALIILGFFQPLAWIAAAVLYALNVGRRMTEKGRWRQFINPVRIVVGAYALSAFDLGMTVGAIEGLAVLLRHEMPKVRKNGSERHIL